MDYQVSLTEMLDARERRTQRQQKLLAEYQMTIISFTMNIAGPVKNSRLIRNGFELGKRELKRQLDFQNVPFIYGEEIHEPTGNEAFFLVDADPLFIKRITCSIEDNSEIGRLFDMDVLRPSGEKTDRTELGLSPRRCLICSAPAKECARSRAHTIEQLQARTTEILSKAIEDDDSCQAARLASRALLYEVCTTPKPGLVDRMDNGSHKDMDIFTFMDSASSLWPYFETCTRIGRQTCDLPAPSTFQKLRSHGKKAEMDMFSATKGINTHKGAIFTIGILCAALGRLSRQQWTDSDAVLKECAAMTKGLTASDFAGLTEKTAVTAGQKLYLQYKITGIRGQMEEGLPAVREVGLPHLKAGLKKGLTINDAGCGALLALMAAATDTNIIARSSLSTQQEIAVRLKELLNENPFPDSQFLCRLNKEFKEKNISPGGSADLLAVCYLLYFLEQTDPGEGL